jgi:hypothetical protein
VESCKLRYFNSFEFFDHTGREANSTIATGNCCNFAVKRHVFLQ